MNQPPRFDLGSFLPYRLVAVADRVSAEFAAVYGARRGLSRAEWRVMAHLWSAGQPLSVREIHQRVDMDKPAVSRAAARLELMGLIEKGANPDDGRLVALALTAEGRAVMADLIPLARAFEARLRDRLGPADAAALERILDRLSADQAPPAS